MELKFSAWTNLNLSALGSCILLTKPASKWILLPDLPVMLSASYIVHSTKEGRIMIIIGQKGKVPHCRSPSSAAADMR